MKNLLRFLNILAVIIFIFSIPSLHANMDLYSRVAPSCVEILVNCRLDGSGVICNKKGLVLTAFHVVKKRQKTIEALSKTLGRLPLRLIATNRGSDLALFSLPEKKFTYPALSLAKNIPVEGTDVFLMASPIFRHHLLLKGCISRRSETYSWYDGSFKNTFPIAGIAAPGSSGGPWLNSKGEIFAIQVAGVTTDFGHQGVNSAVGIKHLKSFLESRKTVIVPTIQAAVEELWGQSTRLIGDMPKNIKGLLFRQVSPSGICATVGIKDEDIMINANNLVFERIEPFINYIRAQKIGTEINFIVCNSSGKNERQVTIKLAELK